MRFMQKATAVYKGKEKKENIEVNIRYTIINDVIKEIRCMEKLPKGYHFDSIYIPDSFKDENGVNYKVSTIGPTVFVQGNLKNSMPMGTYQHNINKLIISDNISVICPYAFDSLFGLISVVWPKSCKSISYACFSYCKNLREIQGIEEVTKIEPEAFYSTGIENFIWPEKCFDIPISCFYGCTNLTKISISNRIKSIGDYAFLKTAIKEFDASAFYMVDISSENFDKDCKITYPFYHIQ